MFLQHFQVFALLLTAILALLIPIVAIVLHYRGKAHSERLRHETIRELIRAGQPIPPELLEDAQDSDWHRARREQAHNPNRILIPVVINVAAGLGLMAMFAAMSWGSWLWAIGLLPLFFGLGLAVYWAIERKQQQPSPLQP